jgi:putative transposase
MPRRPRDYIAGYPYHVRQRGINRANCFRKESDRIYYLALWKQMSSRYDLVVHAYCLMNNHIHFLVTPGQVDSISRVTRVVGSSYAAHFNRKYHRTGTLWEGRHKSSLVQTDRYLMTCYRYIELNPVRAGLADSPATLPWSSYAANGQGRPSWVTPHAGYLALGSTSVDRRARYCQFLAKSVCDEELETIRRATHYCVPTAEADYLEHLEAELGIKLGRPPETGPKMIKK